MRVVAGRARGRRLVAPAGRDVRPTSDRVREAVFNALSSQDRLVGATVVDLFAGSGAMGIEAWSRGAAAVTFVERDPAALGAIRANLATVGVDGARVVAADVTTWAGAGEPVDLVLADPPYAFSDAGWAALLGRLRAEAVVAESDRAVAAPPGWEVLRCRSYGRTVVTVLGQSGTVAPGTTVHAVGTAVDEGDERAP